MLMSSKWTSADQAFAMGRALTRFTEQRREKESW